MRNLIWILFVNFIYSGCAALNKPKEIKITDKLRPPTQELNELYVLLSSEAGAEKIGDLEDKLKKKTFEHELWRQYLLGLSLIKQNKASDALNLYLMAYDQFIKNVKHDKKDLRLILVVLEKIASIYTDQEKFEKAYLYNQFRLSFAKGYGTIEEMYLSYAASFKSSLALKNYLLSEYYLLEGINLIKKIEIAEVKYQLLAESYRALSDLYLKMKNFKKAEDASLKSLISRKRLEKADGNGYKSLVFAYYETGLFYEKYAKELELIGKENFQIKRLALDAFKKAAKLGKDRDVSNIELKKINDSIQRVKSI